MDSQGKEHMPLSRKVYFAVRERFEGMERLAEPAKFNYASKGAYFTFSTNLHPKRGMVKEVFLEACETVKSAVKEHIGDNGEIIEYKVSEGCIIDGGKVWFHVLEGFIIEAYCFTCESVSFTRVLHEKDPRRNTEWVSVDCDESLETSWFD